MELSLNEQQLLRRQSLEQLRAIGIDPYPAALFPVNATAEEIKSEFPENPDKFKQVVLKSTSTS
jgi:lysyl-tRNA synthetase class 2